MSDVGKTKEQLINELEEMRQRIAELEVTQAERKRMEEALQQSEKRYRSLFENSKDAVYVTTRDGKFANVNQSMLQLFGYTKEEMVEMDVRQIYARPEDRRRFQQKIEQQGFVKEYEMKFRRKDGTDRDCLVTATVRTGEDRDVLGYQGIISDITERKQAEELLQASEEWLSITLRSIGDAVIVIDAKGYVALMNPVAQTLTGWNEEDAMGKPLKDVFNIINEKTGKRAENPVTRVIREGIVVGLANHTVLIAKDGTKRPVDDSGAPIRDDRGNITGVVLVFRDVTERKRLEHDIRESLKELQCLYSISQIAGRVGISLNETCQKVANLLPLSWQYPEITCSRITVNGDEFRTENYRDTGWRQCADIETRGAKIGTVEVSYLEERTAIDEGPFSKEERALINAVAKHLAEIIELKRAEERVGHLTLTLRAIRNVNQLITREKNREKLIQKVCDTLTATRGFYGASIIVLDETGKLVTHGESGLGEDFVTLIKQMKPGKLPDCGRRALEQSEVVVIKDPASTCTGCPLSDKYGSPVALVIRLEHEGKVYGLLKASIPTAFVTDEETTLFKEVAQDIALALHDMELEAGYKQAVEELQESEEKYRGLVTNLRLGIFRSTPEPAGRFLEVNPAMVNITGYSRKELLQMNVSDLYTHPEERELVLEEVASGKRKVTREIYLRKKDGTEIVVSDAKVAMKDDASQILYFDGILEDITERRQLEEEHQKIEKLESIGTLAGGIAHDFNNLLTGIMGNIGLARRYAEPKSKAEERLLEAEKASLRAKDLTQQLLTFARGGAPVKKLVSIAELIQDSATFALRGSNVRCEFSLPDNLWSAEVDEGQMNQVISNLVINADEAMPEGGILNIGIKNRVVKTRNTLPLPEGNYVEITIEDHGVGISKEHLRKIFDPYFTTKQKGSGLGLSTAYSIIKNHGGYITAKSKLEVGTTFRIYLPASEKPIPAKKEEVAEMAIAGKGRVLVMDDEEVIRELLHDELTDIGYEVELAVDGAEAIEQYTKAKESGQPFDAVILDLTVPGGMGGKEVIEKMLEIDPSVKAIVSSGYSTDPIMSDFKEYGFSGVVAKPYKMEQLEKTLRSILKGKGE